MTDKILGPIQLEAKVHLAHPDGHQAAVTYTFPLGKPVTVEDLERATRKAVAAAEAQGFGLMGADTFFNCVVVKEKTGQVGNFALPSDFDYGEPWDIATIDTDRPRHSFDDDDEYDED